MRVVIGIVRPFRRADDLARLVEIVRLAVDVVVGQSAQIGKPVGDIPDERARTRQITRVPRNFSGVVDGHGCAGANSGRRPVLPYDGAAVYGRCPVLPYYDAAVGSDHLPIVVQAIGGPSAKVGDRISHEAPILQRLQTQTPLNPAAGRLSAVSALLLTSARRSSEP